jgi:hypothetical protein
MFRTKILIKKRKMVKKRKKTAQQPNSAHLAH